VLKIFSQSRVSVHVCSNFFSPHCSPGNSWIVWFKVLFVVRKSHFSVRSSNQSQAKSPVHDKAFPQGKFSRKNCRAGSQISAGVADGS